MRDARPQDGTAGPAADHLPNVDPWYARPTRRKVLPMSNATLSRRTFATGLAAVGLAAASLALTGCGEDKTATDD